MNPNRFRSARMGAAVLASVSLLAAPAAAQVQGYSGVGAFREDAGSALSRHLRTLADNPRNQSALMGAGEAALKLGDPQAAITFFARAEEIAPRDGRIKAGIGSAFVQMEQPHSALKFFSDAASLGVPEGEFAGDRGLAYDVIGNPKQAQRDYALALRHQPDPEIERRLALSLAISGDKAGALAAIDAQLRRQDRAGWRTRAFVLALTGDSAGANEAVQSVMPGQAAALRPFLARLPSLDVASRAMAVHFGHFPGDGQTVQMAQNYSAQPSYGASQFPSLGSALQAGQPDRNQQALTPVRNTQPQPVSTASRRRPGVEEPVTRPPATRPAATASRTSPRQDEYETRVGSRFRTPVRDRVEQRADARPQQPRTPGIAAPSTQRPVDFALSSPRIPTQQSTVTTAAPSIVGNSGAASSVQANVPAPAQTQPAPQVTVPPAASPSTSLPTATASQPGPAASIRSVDLPGSTVSSSSSLTASAQPQPTLSISSPAPSASAPINVVSTETPPATEKPTAGATGLADIAALVNSLPAAEAEEKKSAKAPTQLAQLDVKKEPAKAAEEKKAEPKKTESASKEPAKKEPAKPSEPSRHWVQIAGSADRQGLMREFGRLKQKAPKLLGDRSAWTTPLRFTNRLLVGPFKSENEAQAFVNELSKADLSAFSWTSPAGQEIEKLSAK